MATIAQDIEQIRKAEYGKNVREAIADGIEKCYSDISSAKTIADDYVKELPELITEARNATIDAANSISYFSTIFSESKEYIEGDYVIYNGALYQFILDHPAGKWNIADVKTITVGKTAEWLEKIIGKDFRSRSDLNIIPFLNAKEIINPNGVSYEKITENSWRVHGTSGTASETLVFVRESNQLLEKDAAYYLEYTAKDVRFTVVVDGVRTVYRTTSGVIVPYPSYTKTIYVMLLVPPSTTVDETVTIKLTRYRKNTVNHNAKYLSVGNSILTGSVWKDGAMDHLSSYDNSPYGIIAKSLGIPEDNVTHTLKSSSGLFEFVPIIKRKDISELDYIVTHLYESDLSSLIGTVDSEASDGTIAGLVAELCEFIASENPRCHLILLGPMPSSNSPDKSGEKVFSGIYPNNYSIHDVDILMRKMSEIYRFTFVDFEDFNLSYHWLKYTDGNNIHANSEDTYRMLGEYITSKIRQPISSEEDSATVSFSKTNFAVFENSKRGIFKQLDCSSLNNGDVIRVSNKNLFYFMTKWSSGARNNTKFTINRNDGSISIVANHETENGFSIRSSDDDDAFTPSGIRCLFYVIFPEDTVVTFSGNRNKPMEYSDQVYFQVGDGNTTFRDYGHGITLVCRAGVEYYANIVVFGTTDVGGIPIHTEFTTDQPIIFSPQVEIGGYHTSFEPHEGYSVTYNSSQNTSNLLQIASGSRKSSHSTNSYLIMYPDRSTVDIIVGEELNKMIVVYDKNADKLVNDHTWGYIAKWSLPQDCWVVINTGINDPRLFCQIGDGVTSFVSTSKEILYYCRKDVEYGFRYGIYKGVKDTQFTGLTFSAYCGISGLSTYSPKTVLIVESAYNGMIGGAYYSGDHVCAKSELEKILIPSKRPFKPIISFIDDDTSSLSLVKRYHDMMSSLGVVGNYAVMVKKIIDDPSIKEALLEYETEGFGMLYHCYYQSGTNTDYFLPNEKRDINEVRKNVLLGLGEMRKIGFANAEKHWVTPYGVNDEEIQDVAMECGFETMLSNATHNTIQNGGSTNRYNLPRVSVTINDSIEGTINRIKKLIDAICETNSWMIITTHVNTWDTTNAGEMAIMQIVEYALQKGVEIASFSKAYQSRRGMFYTTEELGNLLYK